MNSIFIADILLKLSADLSRLDADKETILQIAIGNIRGKDKKSPACGAFPASV